MEKCSCSPLLILWYLQLKPPAVIIKNALSCGLMMLMFQAFLHSVVLVSVLLSVHPAVQTAVSSSGATRKGGVHCYRAVRPLIYGQQVHTVCEAVTLSSNVIVLDGERHRHNFRRGATHSLQNPERTRDMWEICHGNRGGFVIDNLLVCTLRPDSWARHLNFKVLLWNCLLKIVVVLSSLQ